MIYQRQIPREELFAAQLELLMQNARFATISIQLIGVVSTVFLFWAFVPFSYLLLWAAGFVIMLLGRSLHMSNALVEHRYHNHPLRLYWELLGGAALTGGIWAGSYIYATTIAPASLQYVFLMLIVLTTAFSAGVSVVIREYFIAYLFCSLWPIAWWSLVHYWDQPYNLFIGLFLLLLCAVLVVVSDRAHRSYRNMLALNWERETMSRELGDLTGSLRDRNRQLRDARRQLTDLANVDELTGLGNRRLVNKALHEEINRARRNGGQLSVILLDVDHFKNYNDTYGHPAGDAVLQQLSDLMQRATSRAGEVVARYGGEEFILILPGASKAMAQKTANRLQALVEEERIVHESSPTAPYITVSQGVVNVIPEPDGGMQPEEVISLADRALYEAKNEGRNRIKMG